HPLPAGGRACARPPGRARALRPALRETLELRREVVPAGPFRLPRRTGKDGLLRRRGRVLERLLHHREEPGRVRVAQPSPELVLFGARAFTAQAAEHGIERMRFALGVEEDLRPFLREFAGDEL